MGLNRILLTSAPSSSSPGSSPSPAAAPGVAARQEPGQRQQLGRVDVEGVRLLEGLGLAVLRHLDGHEEVAEGAEDLVNLADLKTQT